MGDVTETELPGVGVRYDLATSSERTVGVVVHQTGRRDLVVYDERDPDRAAESVALTEDEGHTLSELLGGSRVTESLEEAVLSIEDLRIAWVRVEADSPIAGLQIADTGLRRRTGAGIVALVSESGSTPVPGGTAELMVGDVAVVVGLPAAVEAASRLLAP